jgi:hypothetical protein
MMRVLALVLLTCSTCLAFEFRREPAGARGLFNETPDVPVEAGQAEASGRYPWRGSSFGAGTGLTSGRGIFLAHTFEFSTPVTPWASLSLRAEALTGFVRGTFTWAGIIEAGGRFFLDFRREATIYFDVRAGLATFSTTEVNAWGLSFATSVGAEAGGGPLRLYAELDLRVVGVLSRSGEPGGRGPDADDMAAAAFLNFGFPRIGLRFYF